MKCRRSRQANRIQIAHRIYHVQGRGLSVSEFLRVTQGRPQFLQHRRQKNKPSLQDIRLTNTTRTSSFFSHETWPDLTERKKENPTCASFPNHHQHKAFAHLFQLSLVEYHDSILCVVGEGGWTLSLTLQMHNDFNNTTVSPDVQALFLITWIPWQIVTI